MFDEDREDQKDDGRDDEPELFLQGVLVMVMFMRVLMTFVVVMMFVRRMGLVVVMMLVMVLMGATLVVIMFM